MYQCFNCNTRWESSLRQPAVKEICEACGAYLHCCRNCTHYRPGYPNDCYVPDTEKVADKSRANFCDDFEFLSESTKAKRQRITGQSDDALNALFGSAAEAEDSSKGVKDWLKTAEKENVDFEDLFND